MATTVSPTRRLPESPNCAGVRPVASTWSTARSDTESAPTSMAGSVRPSVSCAVTEMPFSTTWQLVTMYPSSVRITPVPVEVAL